MSPPKTTVWKLEPHTVGKHLVLRAYLNAWIPILSKWNQRILFVDAFAGPGRYKKGEDGSPIIALKALSEHPLRSKITSEIIFLFVEKDVKRFESLSQIVDDLKPNLPSNAIVQVINGTFDVTMSKVLDQVEEQNQLLAPSFVMIDPFGISETPMSVINRILKNPKSEVYISIMYNHINRFLSTPEFALNLDQLFGCSEWKNAIDIEDTDQRRKFLFNLYEKQLKLAGAKYVLSFDLYEDNKHIYTIFFGAKNLLGCDRMKAGIWKIAPTGNFRFVGTKSEQMAFNIKRTNFDPLKKELQNEFTGRGWVSIDEVLDFVRSDRTDYHSGQVKTNVLKKMEDDNNKEIEVDENTRSRRKTYPKGTMLQFIKK